MAKNDDVWASVRLLVMGIAVLAIARSVSAGISAQNSSVQISQDGTRILVMVSPSARGDQGPTATLPDGRTVNIHDAFPKSGVYDASTLRPVWQVDWFALQGELIWSDDLQHIARLNRFGYRSNWAIAFYDQGKEVGAYGCAFLLTGLSREWSLPYSSWDWHTRWYGTVELDATGTTVLLSTARRRVYVMHCEVNLGLQEFYAFDLASGKLVSRRRVGAWVAWVYSGVAVAVGVAVILAGTWVFWRTSRDGAMKAGWSRVKRGAAS